MKKKSRIDSFMGFLFRFTDVLREISRRITEKIERTDIKYKKRVVCILSAALVILLYIFGWSGTVPILTFAMFVYYIMCMSDASRSVRQFLKFFLFINAVSAFFLTGVVANIFSQRNSGVTLVLYIIVYCVLSAFSTLIAEEDVAKMAQTFLSISLSILTGFINWLSHAASLVEMHTETIKAIADLYNVLFIPIMLINYGCTLLAVAKDYWRKKYGITEKVEVTNHVETPV